MTTSDAVLTALQTAWQQTPATPAEPPRCKQHIDPADWLDEPAANRPGWIRTTCRRCGGFVGFRRDGG